MRGPNGGDDAAAEGAEGNWNRTLHLCNEGKAGPADAWWC